MAKKILTEEDKNAIWFFIESKFFTPKRKNSRGWLVAYGKFIKQILEIKDEINKPILDKSVLEQNNPVFFHFGKFTFSIELTKTQIEKFAVTLIVDNEQHNYHFDKTYSLNETVLIYDKIELQNKIENSKTSGEFESVVRELLEKKIVHPALHNHPTKEEFHGIRLSFAIENPFLFLYHLVFQLIERGADYHDKNKLLKGQELSRLVNVIVKNFDLKHENKIDVRELFQR